jgi:hypothetical protein
MKRFVSRTREKSRTSLATAGRDTAKELADAQVVTKVVLALGRRRPVGAELACLRAQLVGEGNLLAME